MQAIEQRQTLATCVKDSTYGCSHSSPRFDSRRRPQQMLDRRLFTFCETALFWYGIVMTTGTGHYKQHLTKQELDRK